MLPLTLVAVWLPACDPVSSVVINESDHALKVWINKWGPEHATILKPQGKWAVMGFTGGAPITVQVADSSPAATIFDAGACTWPYPVVVSRDLNAGCDEHKCSFGKWLFQRCDR